MSCTSPKTVGFLDDGKTLCWSPKKYSKEFATFQLPCGKCLSCRLEYSRQLAIRCVHEASMHESNCFVTLTYNDTNLGSNRLDYRHFQTFIKKLRNNIFQEFLDQEFPGWPQSSQRKEWAKMPKEERERIYGPFKIGVLGTGEYGDKSKRIHWHAIIFNWKPKDLVYKKTTELGHRVFNSKSLEDLWGRGIVELGSVTFESAGYCARYATKKLVHGRDGEHEYEPISKRSCRQAIGKSWIEKYYKDVFSYGYVVLKNGAGNYIRTGIPRYYEKWLRVRHPDYFRRYLFEVKASMQSKAQEKQDLQNKEIEQAWTSCPGGEFPISNLDMEEKCLREKIARLQQKQKF